VLYIIYGCDAVRGNEENMGMIGGALELVGNDLAVE